MNRLTVVQRLIEKFQSSTYLEIGVYKGGVISKVRAPRKIGIDIQFQLSLQLRIENLLRVGNRYFTQFESTSDVFFHQHARQVLKAGIDVALVDGLHTYNQTLLDIENCLQFLNPEGVIVVHDCNPPTFASAYPVQKSITEVLRLAHAGELSGWSSTWHGDTWKAMVHMRIKYPDLEVFTIDLDWGLGIITKKQYGLSQPLLDVTVEDLENADFGFLATNRDRLLKLVSPKTFFDTLNQIKP